jgi:hypothetical protein
MLSAPSRPGRRGKAACSLHRNPVTYELFKAIWMWLNNAPGGTAPAKEDS